MKTYAELMVLAAREQREQRARKITFLRRQGQSNATVRAMVGKVCYSLPFGRMSVRAIVRKAISVRRESRDSRLCAECSVRQGMPEIFRRQSLAEREQSAELILIARFKSGQPLNSRLRRAVAELEANRK